MVNTPTYNELTNLPITYFPTYIHLSIVHKKIEINKWNE